MADHDTWKELRKPFDPKVIGKIPKGGMQLDYVGHAAVTDRLLTVDPEWSWEPMGFDEQGLPALDSSGNLWIKLTVSGVTRIGVGDGKNAKERIGDALRNAAMRFGVALDLWSKDELESHLDAPDLKNEKPSQAKKITTAQIGELLAVAKNYGYTDKTEAMNAVTRSVGTGLPDIEADRFDEVKRLVEESLQAKITTADGALLDDTPWAE